MNDGATPPALIRHASRQPRRSARWLIALLAVALAAAALAGSPRPAEAAATLAPPSYADQLLAMLNQERLAAGLPELVEAAPAVRVAARRVLDMAENNYFAHTSPSGVSWVDLLRAEGMPFGWGGENIALCDYPPTEVAAVMHRSLMASNGHRENILRPEFRQVGIAVAVNGRNAYYAAFIFTD
jgi:uncharacterized protein YkwD